MATHPARNILALFMCVLTALDKISITPKFPAVAQFSSEKKITHKTDYSSLKNVTF